MSEIEEQVTSTTSDIDDLIGEMEEWKDSIPENLQGSDKASEIEECIDALNELKDSIEGLDFSSVSFPAMMG